MSEDARAIAAAVRSGERSAREVCLAALARAVAAEELGALWHVDADGALAAADTLDRERLRGGRLGVLAGVPVVVKDAFEVAGMPGGGGGPVVTGARDAEAVARLRAAGAIVLGKAAMHQLGWGTAGQSPGRPVCRNPRVAGGQPGGSSSGSAVAVAAEIVPVALGADTAGSVRVPAVWCGVVGVKPQRRFVPRGGLLALAPEFDAVGWMTGNLADARLVARALGSGEEEGAVSGVRVVADARAFEAAEPAVRDACAGAVERLRAAGAAVREADPRLPRARVGALYAAALARAWGARVRGDPDAYGTDVVEGVRAGLLVSDDEERAALDALAAARAAGNAVAERLDVVVGPTLPVGVAALDAGDDVAARTRFTRPYNVLDWPAISVPCGEAGAPAGLQVAAPRGREAAMWAVAEAVA